MAEFNGEIAKKIALNYCITNSVSDFNYIVVGKNTSESPPYYLYEIMLAQNDMEAKMNRIEPGELMIKVYENNSKAEVVSI